MSHRKFENPRHGNLGFLPRKHCKRHRAKVTSFPRDDPTLKPHLTCFMGYKAGMTHIVRDLDKPGSAMNKKEVVEAVTILETPPMVVVGIVGYTKGPYGLKSVGTVWAHHLDTSVKRRVQKQWYKSRKSAFAKHIGAYHAKPARIHRKTTLKKLARRSEVIRVIAHTQVKKLPQLSLKKAHMTEIQVNGGTIGQKINFGIKLFEKLVSVDQIFKQNEMIDIIGLTKGHGFTGVIKRWGVRRLPRKTHRGLRKVACIGAWHPERVSYTIARAGQMGYWQRVKYNNKIFMIGKNFKTQEGKEAGKTEFDLTEKGINPMGGFINYGVVKHEFVMIKGTIHGVKKRVCILRKSLGKLLSRDNREEIKLKFIDTASKRGPGHFQTHKEKKKFIGPRKRDLEKKRERELKNLAKEKKTETKKDAMEVEKPKEQKSRKKQKQ